MCKHTKHSQKLFYLSCRITVWSFPGLRETLWSNKSLAALDEREVTVCGTNNRLPSSKQSPVTQSVWNKQVEPLVKTCKRFRLLLKVSCFSQMPLLRSVWLITFLTVKVMGVRTSSSPLSSSLVISQYITTRTSHFTCLLMQKWFLIYKPQRLHCCTACMLQKASTCCACPGAAASCWTCGAATVLSTEMCRSSSPQTSGH